jgi:hypothetical protein
LGHSGSHAPQLIHSSVMKVAIQISPLVKKLTRNRQRHGDFAGFVV